MQLYNTATHRLEAKQWGTDVTMYVCGITPYDSAHMGHAFTFMTYDILQRYLEYQGHRVRMVRNITDVDEPIYAKAAELGIPYMQLAAEETAEFQAVMRRLGLIEPFAEPKASEYIDQMAAAVQQLVASKRAYKVADDIYFDVATFPTFGKQSGFSKRLQLAFMTDRGGDPQRPGKRNPLDFLLWKNITDLKDPAAWDTPLGHGRPGWHIECSVMSSELLGTPIDIHGGGMDLIFPHHEAENAQSVSLGHDPFVKHWMHVAPLYCAGEKMSKSLGNLVFAKDLLRKYSPAVIRLALLQYHYRIGGEWHNDALKAAQNQLHTIQRALVKPMGPDPAMYLEQFHEGLENDLDTPEAMHIVMHLACDTLKKPCPSRDGPRALREMLTILGIAV